MSQPPYPPQGPGWPPAGGQQPPHSAPRAQAAHTPQSLQAPHTPQSPQSPKAPKAPRPPRARRGGAGVLVGALVLGLLGGVGGAAGYSALRDDSGPEAAPEGGGGGGDGDTRIDAANIDTASLDPIDLVSVNDVANAVLPAVVQINVPSGGGVSQGTGFVISESGEIVTNEHVVSRAESGRAITIAFDDGGLAEADIVGTDPVLDVAVLQLRNADGVSVASLGSSDETQVGQAVVAIGSPYGLTSTVTAGIVSAVRRPVVGRTDEGITAYPAVQIDAAINSGNSGGPLVNMRGEVVGINAALRPAVNDTGTADPGFIGIGYAIGLDDAWHVIEAIRAGEPVEHADLGVQAEPVVVNDAISGAARITDAGSGAGAEAGLEAGDIVVALDGMAINGVEALLVTMLTYEPGEEFEITVLRGGERTNLQGTMGSDRGA